MHQENVLYKELEKEEKLNAFLQKQIEDARRKKEEEDMNRLYQRQQVFYKEY